MGNDDQDNNPLGGQPPSPDTGSDQTPGTSSPVSPADAPIISSAGLPTATPLNAPLPTDSLHPLQTTGSGEGDIVVGHRQGFNKKPLIIIGVIVLVVAIIIALLVFLLPHDDDVEAPVAAVGEVNTAAIFDPTAPIPLQIDSTYIYISPEDGSQLIADNFLSADRFYGDYAVVKSGTEEAVSQTLLINRSGKTIFSFEGNNTSTYYDIENNVWIIDGDAYNIELQKLSPEGTTSSYIGNGYILIRGGTQNVTNETEQESPTDGEASADESNGEGSQASSDSAGQTDSDEYIADLDGKRVYDCEQYCSAFTVDSDGTIYAVVRMWGGHSQIVNLSNSEVIYTTSQGSISQEDGVLTESSDDTIKYLTIQNNQISSSSQPTTTTVTTVSDGGEYIIEPCEEAKYTIKTLDGKIVSDCDIDDYYELPPILYKAYQNDFKQSPILITRDEELMLFDMAKGKVERTYTGQDVYMFDESPFLHTQDVLASESYVCNILSKKQDGKNSGCLLLEDENATVDGYSNYFTVEGRETMRLYNADLKETRQW